jgi:phosphoribosylanthranilate isomerase
MTRVKVCGITTPEDAAAAVEAGADAIGVVFAESPRRVTVALAQAIAQRVPPLVSVIGVFMDQPLEQVAEIAQAVGLDAVQLHGDETPEDCERLSGKVIKRFKVAFGDSVATLASAMSRYRVDAYLLDPGAGSGRAFDWSLAIGLPQPLIVSGGLTPANVAEAVRIARPYAVDVSSGVERSPGRKDLDKVRAFFRAAKGVAW